MPNEGFTQTHPNWPKLAVGQWSQLKIGVFSVAISKHIWSPFVHSPCEFLTHQDDRKVFPEDFI
jgi:hypothetical protein